MMWIGIDIAVFCAFLCLMTYSLCKACTMADECMERELNQFMQKRQGCLQHADSLLYGEEAVNG